MPAVMPKLALLALASTFADAARVQRRKVGTTAPKTKTVAGVPIYNYDLRFAQDEAKRSRGASADLDWVIMFKGDATEEDMLTFCGGPAKKGACRVMGHVAKGGVPFATALVSEQQLLKMLEANSAPVDFVEPDLPVYVIPELDEVQSEEPLWGHDTINLEQSSFTGAGVHIYVMDTGVRTTHEDFGGRAIPTVDTILGEGEPVECNGDPTCADDTQGHGTHCAGTAGGTKYGAARESTIHAMKVCCGPGTNTIAAMDWVGLNAERPAVVTMSLGSWGNSLADKVSVDMVTEAGIIVVVSAGNNNADACEKTFAFIDAAFTVGSTTVEDARSAFSNFGTCVNLWAPGSRILSASNLDDASATLKSGTSMATPLVAGVAGLILDEFPLYTPAQVKAELVRRSKKSALDDLKDDDFNALLSAV